LQGGSEAPTLKLAQQQQLQRIARFWQDAAQAPEGCASEKVVLPRRSLYLHNIIGDFMEKKYGSWQAAEPKLYECCVFRCGPHTLCML